MKLLYLHGFRSNPDSPKALAVIEYCQLNGLSAPIVPQLVTSPKESIKLCERLIQEHAINAVCGSSLGGFYAMYLAEKFGLRCAVINPAITPWHEIGQHDVQVRYQVADISSDDTTRYLAELMHYETVSLTDLSRYLLLVATADEVLNPQQMMAHFKGAPQIVVEGGDHVLNDFGGHLDALMRFLQQ